MKRLVILYLSQPNAPASKLRIGYHGKLLAHYYRSTSAFSAASLLGVKEAIDDLADCFKYTDPPGSVFTGLCRNVGFSGPEKAMFKT
jgi:hypothetical protein